MIDQKLSGFLKQLQAYESKSDTFNPWANYDEVYDYAPEAPQIRLAQLSEYLSSRITKTEYILCAEAVGYQGGKFSGVPLTSERILLGHQAEIPVTGVIPSGRVTRT